jgi:hypothetical protein
VEFSSALGECLGDNIAAGVVVAGDSGTDHCHLDDLSEASPTEELGPMAATDGI